jgi:hypothetical protein
MGNIILSYVFITWEFCLWMVCMLASLPEA